MWVPCSDYEIRTSQKAGSKARLLVYLGSVCVAKPLGRFAFTTRNT